MLACWVERAGPFAAEVQAQQVPPAARPLHHERHASIVRERERDGRSVHVPGSGSGGGVGAWHLSIAKQGRAAATHRVILECGPHVQLVPVVQQLRGAERVAARPGVGDGTHAPHAALCSHGLFAFARVG